jgi:hypothetical protein
MKEARIKFWRSEMAMLDTVYRARMIDWQRLVDEYDLKFAKRIRDLADSELVVSSEFYPLVKQIIATVAMNYPRLAFEVQDDAAYGDDMGMDVSDTLERASSSLFEITEARDTVHQAILNGLFGMGWIRIDLNPVGDDIIPPYVANSPDEEDLVSFTNCGPGAVHVDPLVQPHKLGTARYIREPMYIPIKQLRDDAKRAKDAGYNFYTLPKDLKASGQPADDDIGFGELMYGGTSSEEQTANKEALEAGEFLRVDRIHDRMERKLLMFMDGVDQPILDRPHPMMRRVFPQRTDARGVPMWTTPEGYDMAAEEPIGDPMLDLETMGKDGDLGEPGVGFLCRHGFPFVNVKFGMHPNSFYPKGELAYVEDLQNVLVESMSRKASLLRRFSRINIITDRVEKALGPDGVRRLTHAEDGETIVVPDGTTKDDIWVLDMSGIPAGQNDIEDRARFQVDRITKVNEMSAQGSGDMTATQSALIGAAIEVNRAWMEAKVSGVYVDLCRNAFNVFGDPRYTPENFIENVAPDGKKRLSRALTASDFLWKYRISAQAFSMQPLFEQLQKDKFIEFYDRAIQSPNIDRKELDKQLTAIYITSNPDKFMVKEGNPAEARAAQLENDRIISQQQDPGVLPEQDHQTHAPVHAGYQNHPTYLQIMQRAQQIGGNGVPVDPQAAMYIQQVDQLMQAHMAAHQAAEAQAGAQIQGGRRPSAAGAGPRGLQGQVQSNAQEVSNAVEIQGEEAQAR